MRCLEVDNEPFMRGVKMSVALHMFCFQLGEMRQQGQRQPAAVLRQLETEHWRCPAPRGAQARAQRSGAIPRAAPPRPRGCPLAATGCCHCPARCEPRHLRLKGKVTLALGAAHWHVNERQFWLTRENPTAIISGTWKCRTRDLRSSA